MLFFVFNAILWGRFFYEANMVLQSDISKIRYICDGSATEFPIPFKYFKNADSTSQIKVIFGEGEDETVLEENTDFTVAGEGLEIKGKIVFVEAPTANSKLAILRDIPVLQDADLVNGEYIDMEELERMFDRIYMLIQEHNEKLGRAVLTDALSDEEPGEFAERVLGYKEAAQKAANDAIDAANEVKALVDKIGLIVDQINGEVI